MSIAREPQNQTVTEPTDTDPSVIETTVVEPSVVETSESLAGSTQPDAAGAGRSSRARAATRVVGSGSGLSALTRLPRPDVVDEDPGVVLGGYRRRVLVTDVVSGLVAGWVGLGLRFGGGGRGLYVGLAVVLPVVWVVLVGLQRGYEGRFLGSGVEEYRRVGDAGLVLFVVIAVASYVLVAQLSRGFVVVVVPLTVAGSLVWRHVWRGWLFRLRGAGRGLARVLVVGRADAAVAVIEKLDREVQHGLVAVGACVPSVGVEVSHVHGVPVVGDPSRIVDAVEVTGAHVVAVVSHPDLSGAALRRLSWALEERGVELVVSPGIVEVAGPRLSIRPVAGLSLLHLERPAAGLGRRLVKAGFDRVVAGLLVVGALPVLVGIAVAVRCSGPGPVLFRQVRVGVGGRLFTMVKFRSMVVDAEARLAGLAGVSEGNGVLFKLRADPRVTRVGAVLRRYSLDELPQLFNVLRGEMSLVGPRPPLPAEVAVYDDDAARRLRVKPGLTGLWQVSGRSDLSWEESLRLDLRYVDNWSLAMDLTILWRTLRAMTTGSGAY